MIHISSVLLFILSLIILFQSSFSLWKKSKDTLEDYVIDVLFTNSLTIIRCNPYERHTLRPISIGIIGHIKCSNRNLFLPDNHIEQITLVQWDYTQIKCDKKNTSTKEERTYLDVKHGAKDMFKKQALEMIRVGSTGLSKFHWKTKQTQFYFEHATRQLTSTDIDTSNRNFTMQIYSFKQRPIICRERRLLSKGFCSDNIDPKDFSYVCYYKIGVAEPPKIAEMEKELRTLLKTIDPNDDSPIDNYINKTPLKKPSSESFHMVIFIIVGIAIVIVVFVIICCCCCCSGQTRRIDSDTSITSDIS